MKVHIFLVIPNLRHLKTYIPYLKNSILLIGILLAIEIIKELPITLIMRPFNFETFATKHIFMPLKIY